MKQTTLIEQLFPRASKSFVEANAAIGTLPVKENHSSPVAHGKQRGSMNATEAEFALMLEAQEREGKIVRYVYEGITLRWADMNYTPDFFVLVARSSQFDDSEVGTEWNEFYQYKVIEVKGGHIWDRDIVRFKGARECWKEFQFEMWQRKGGQWKRLH
jgi:hypothetical protein